MIIKDAIREVCMLSDNKRVLLIANRLGGVMKKILFFCMIAITLNTLFYSKALASDSKNSPHVNSEAVILMEEKTGRVLYQKNADLNMYPASLTKVATAIYAIEKGNLDDIVSVSKNARYVDGTRVYLEEGEKVPLKKLVQGLLINSGNDSGVAIAEHLDSSEKAFAANLNKYMRAIGLQDTNFENPHGLFNPEHTTTARDLAKITQYAMKNEVFREIFGTKELKWKGEAWETTLFNHHKLMRERPYEGVTGGKTGYVDQSGQTLITTATREGMSVIAVILKGQTQAVSYNDTIELLDYAFTGFKVFDIPKGKEFKTNNNTFVTEANKSFPISKNEKVREDITDPGVLEIRNQNQALIASFQLNKAKKPETIEGRQKEKQRIRFGFQLLERNSFYRFGVDLFS
ncbi:D-alanyl-D-alanine carboxypeptidase family protein [Peribacillus frigoritolerans]|uniref:D-alanyl-D-alanine carboxypeptidase family protein n=1 Tax=Peribacillus frigoritolerans TaxID=450367 RepID=UPI0020795458|nr:D-alanyl-D-alanine carboxypeptidase family protein [Peribacillus frigoritolerans]USK67021.1 D-alanyl-D-alanine carboxypeptidase [Peribacillus frigoritolerans]